MSYNNKDSQINDINEKKELFKTKKISKFNKNLINILKITFNLLFFIFRIIGQCKSFSSTNQILVSSSEITLKVQGTGDINLFDSIYECPSKLYINETNIAINNNDCHQVNIKSEEDANSLIRLEWDNIFTSAYRLFYSCNQIIEINMTNFDTSLITSMEEMFDGCYNLKFLYLENFDTSNVKTFSYMLYHCQSLISININHFETKNVVDMSHMFDSCEIIEILNISNFNTKNVTNMEEMFRRCYKLKILNLENFDTSKVSTFYRMFESCDSLEVLDISNFIINNDEAFNQMFDCDHLISINLENLVISNLAAFMQDLYNYSSNLKYINFLENKNTTINSIFDSVSNNIVICINIKKSPRLYNLIIGKYTKITISCDSEIIKTNDNFNTEIIIPNLTNILTNISDFNEKEITSMTSKIITSISLKPECENYYSIDNEGNYKCIKNEKCLEEYPYLIISTKQCVKYCSLLDMIKKLCIITYDNKNDKNINNTTYKIEEQFIDNIKNEVENGNIDLSKKILIENSKSILEIDKSEFLKPDNKKKSNSSTIYLGKCEEKLKFAYNISQNESLIIFKLDIKHKNSDIISVEYELYYKFINQSNLTKLNKSYCENTKIQIGIPIPPNKNIDILNPDSLYYASICYIFTSKNGTDITLTQRKKEYSNNAIIEPNCQYNSNDESINKIFINCDIKTNFENKIGGYIPVDKLMYGFLDFKNTFNIKVLKCINLIFRIETLKENYLNYILLSILSLYFTIMFIFKYKEYPKIINIRDYIIYFKLNSHKIKLKLNKDKNDNNNKRNNLNENNIKKKKKKYINNNSFKVRDNIQIESSNDKNKSRKTLRKKNKSNPVKKRGIKIRRKSKSMFNSANSFGLNLNKNNTLEIIEQKNNIFNELSELEIYDNYNKIFNKTDKELNSLSYETALKSDKRNFSQFYFSIIRTNHNLFFSFGKKFDFNSKILKILLFFFNFSVYFTVNAFFSLTILWIKYITKVVFLIL